MPLVETENTENLTENQNPIELEIKPVKPKRQMTEAQLENLKRAREAKALKKQQASATTGVEGGRPPNITLEVTDSKAESKEDSKAVKQLNKNIEKAEKLNKKLISKPIKQNKKLIPKNIKADMQQQFRNQEISAAKELEFKTKVKQEVQKEITRMKVEEAKNKRIQIELEKQAFLEKQKEEELQKQNEEGEEVEEEVEEEEHEVEEEEEEPEVEEEEEQINNEEEQINEEEEEEDNMSNQSTQPPSPPPSPPPVKKVVVTIPDNLKPRRIINQKPPPVLRQNVKNVEPEYASIYQRKNPRRDYGNPFLNRLFNQ